MGVTFMETISKYPSVNDLRNIMSTSNIPEDHYTIIVNTNAIRMVVGFIDRERFESHLSSFENSYAAIILDKSTKLGFTCTTNRYSLQDTENKSQPGFHLEIKYHY